MNRWLLAITTICLIVFFQNCGNNTSFDVDYSIEQALGNDGDLNDIYTGAFKARWAAHVTLSGNSAILRLANITDFNAPAKIIDLGTSFEGALETSILSLPVSDLNLDGYEDILIFSKFKAQTSEPEKFVFNIVSGQNGSILKSQTIIAGINEQLQPPQIARSFSAADGPSYFSVVGVNSTTGARRYVVHNSQLNFVLERSTTKALTLLRDLNNDQTPEFIMANGANSQIISGLDFDTIKVLADVDTSFRGVFFTPDSNRDGHSELVIENQTTNEQTFSYYDLADLKLQQAGPIQAKLLSRDLFSLRMLPKDMSLFGHLKNSSDWEMVALGCPLNGGECDSFQHLNFKTNKISTTSDSLYLDFTPSHVANAGITNRFPALQVADSDNNGLDELVLVYQVPSTLNYVLRVYNPRTDKLIGEQSFGSLPVNAFSFSIIGQWQ